MHKPTDTLEPNATGAEHIQRATKNGATWIDMLNPTTTSLGALAEEYRLHDLQINECQHKSQIPQIEVEADYIFLLLHFPYYVASENRIVTNQVGIFLSESYLVTIHDEPIADLQALFGTFSNQGDTNEHSTPGHILYRIIQNLLVELTGLIYSVIDELDALEASVFDTKVSDGQQIGQLRQKIMRLRRLVAAKNIVLDDLSGAMLKITGKSLSRDYVQNAKTTKKLSALLDEARETIEIYKDVDFTSSTEKTNEILAVLTLLFTLTIPATVIGAFYGMNILLPGGIESGSWTFLGAYTMLKLITGVSIIGAAAMYAYFQNKKWF